MNEKIYQIALTRIDGVGPIGVRSLMKHFTQVSELYDASYKDLIELGIRKSIIQQIIDKTTLESAQKTFDLSVQKGIEILFYQDEKYPKRLQYFDDMPPILYYKGNASLNTSKVIAIVGTRDPSKLGILQCEQLVHDLKDYNATIVSGLAYGIDAKAHETSLQQDLPTIGVMASGMKHIYPSDHQSLAKKMIEHGGILTEFAYDTLAKREHFPMRNRIVAAMVDAVVVVESASKGGSLITAEFANQYNKDVFAFPGRFNDSRAQGCNGLIKKHKAHMIETVDDLAYILRWDQMPTVKQISMFENLSSDEEKIVHHLKHHGETHIDQLTKEIDLPLGKFQSLILNLELKGILKSLPGKRYICIQ